MARQLFTNNTISTLSGTLAQGGTTMVCASGEGNSFPTISDDNYFLLTLFTKDAYANEVNIEVVQVTARTGDTFTIVRDYESMTGQAGGYSYNGITDTVYIELRLTAAGVTNFAQTPEMTTALAGKQPIDATLTALAGVTTAADKLIYATGADTFSTTTLTAAGRALLDDADAEAQRTTLGLVIGTNVAAAGAVTSSGLTMATGSVVYRKTTDTGAVEVQTLATLKTDLGLTGTNSGNETATTTGALVNSATEKAAPVDADMVGLMDSEASNVLKKLSWTNIKATLKTYFDTLYPVKGVITASGLTMATGKILGRATADAGAVEELAKPDGDLVGTTATQDLTNKTVNKVTITAPANGSTLTIADGKTLTVNNTITFSGTDGTTHTLPTTTGTLLSTTGTAAKATVLETARAIYGNNFDGSAALSGIIASTYGGTGNGFTKFSGPASSEKTFTLPNASVNLGYLEVPQNSQSADYTLVIGDAGKHILHPSADTTARTFTIPANASVAFPVGTAITFVNQASAGVMTIAITSDTMRLAGAGTTGSRTLAANGVATAIKLTETEWIISGTGLT